MFRKPSWKVHLPCMGSLRSRVKAIARLELIFTSFTCIIGLYIMCYGLADRTGEIRKDLIEKNKFQELPGRLKRQAFVSYMMGSFGGFISWLSWIHFMMAIFLHAGAIVKGFTACLLWLVSTAFMNLVILVVFVFGLFDAKESMDVVFIIDYFASWIVDFQVVICWCIITIRSYFIWTVGSFMAEIKNEENKAEELLMKSAQNADNNQKI